MPIGIGTPIAERPSHTKTLLNELDDGVSGKRAYSAIRAGHIIIYVMNSYENWTKRETIVVISDWVFTICFTKPLNPNFSNICLR